MTETIRVNFGRPIPVFPLPDTVLLPHATQHLHIFESRYCQMVSDCLDSTGQLAMACYDLRSDRVDDEPRPLRPAVCVGQITEHRTIQDQHEQRYLIQLHGLCRGRIVELFEPDDGKLYRAARIAPTDTPTSAAAAMHTVRRRLRRLLSGPQLSRMCGAETVLKWFDTEEVPTEALLELVGSALVNDAEVKYQLLAEPSPERRAELIQNELGRLDELVRRSDGQPYRDWPKGVSWN